jgi:HAMP domain-containing protein
MDPSLERSILNAVVKNQLNQLDELKVEKGDFEQKFAEKDAGILELAEQVNSLVQEIHF